MLKRRKMNLDGINSIMSSHTPLAALKDEYVMVLSHKVSITDDDSNRYIPNKVLAAFLISDDCKRIDQHISNTRLMARQNSETADSDYFDEKGKL